VATMEAPKISKATTKHLGRPKRVLSQNSGLYADPAEMVVVSQDCSLLFAYSTFLSINYINRIAIDGLIISILESILID